MTLNPDVRGLVLVGIAILFAIFAFLTASYEYIALGLLLISIVVGMFAVLPLMGVSLSNIEQKTRSLISRIRQR